ncbi:MFS transporter [Acinetobacter sp. c3-l95]|uniref:MFS transporter n=1 Tax=Acinetobacter sp. c3-l95 TaxID=3342804 RepID=UPI0035B76A60
MTASQQDNTDSIFQRERLKRFNQTVWAILVGTFFVRFSYFMSWPFLIILLNSIHISPLKVGIMLGASAGISSLSGFYIGYLSDRFGRRNIMVTGCGLAVLSYWALIIATQFWQFFLIMLVLGLVRPMVEMVAKAVLSDHLPDSKDRELAFNLRYFAINIAGGIGALVGLYLALKNPNALFISTSLAYLAYGFWLYRLLPPQSNDKTLSSQNQSMQPHSTPSIIDAFKAICHDTLFLLLIFAILLMLIVYSQVNVTLPQILIQINATTVAHFIVMITVVNCLTVVFFQFPLLKIMENITVGIRTQIGFIMVLFSQMAFLFIDMHSLWAWSTVIFILSLGECIAFPNISVTIDSMAKPELRGSYFGAAMLGDFGSALGPIFGGMIIGQFSHQSYFVFSTILSVLTVLIYHQIVRSQRTAQS